MIDWRSRLTSGMRGIAVEGKDDRIIIEAFLDAGEKEHRWSNWRSRLAIEAAGGINQVLAELDATNERHEVWGLLDKEWRPQDSISELKRKYPKLLILPRIMIENYAIDPDELLLLLPPYRLKQIGEPTLRKTIEDAARSWVLHGALSQVLYEHSAGDFRTRTGGYPNRLLNPPHAPITDETEIESWLRKWHDQLDPARIMPAYQHRVAEFSNRLPSEQFCHCIEGKLFFQEIVVGQILNQFRGKQLSGEWLEELFKTSVPSHCPTDLVPVLTDLLGVPE